VPFKTVPVSIQRLESGEIEISYGVESTLMSEEQFRAELGNIDRRRLILIQMALRLDGLGIDPAIATATRLKSALDWNGYKLP
jgi:hypothetical protein